MGDLYVIKPKGSAEMAVAISELLHDIEDGRVIGVAFVALRPGLQYTVDAVGSAKALPSLARGALQALDDQLAILVGSR